MVGTGYCVQIRIGCVILLLQLAHGIIWHGVRYAAGSERLSGMAVSRDTARVDRY